MLYIAHKREDKNQSIIEHLKGTAKLSSEFAKPLGLSKYAECTAMLHDIGKYTNEFQRRINGQNIKVVHSSSGAKIAFSLRKPASAFCISGHHSGLPNMGSNSDGYNDGTLLGKINSVDGDFSAWKNDQPNYKFSADEPLPKNNEERFLYAFIVRMLFSCLVDADFLDTENFMTNGEVDRNSGEDVKVLKERLFNFVSQWQAPKENLNKLRTQMLNECIEIGKNSNEKIFSLTVPTGGGKTVSSLAFALNYAVKENKRVIYVVPYTSIIEQNAQVFREILGDENVLEHHYNVDYNNDDEENINAKSMELATENWDKPVIVTTAVQFFESLFSNRVSTCRKLHNIANSVIIFDEAQMLPIGYLTPCIYAMYCLTKLCNSAIVLCTATQPSLEEMFKRVSKDESIKINEICKSSKDVFNAFDRTKFVYDGLIEDDVLCDEILKHNQVLCIVNTKAHARKLYEAINKSDGVFCLSTNMYPLHRKRVLEEIKQRLVEQRTCIVISTNLIEAGVDVDFPVVYRAMSGLDSILQAGGRCNREGKRPVEESIVHIFDTQNIGAYQKTNVSVTRMVLGKYKDNINSPDAIKMYFNSLFYYLDADNKGKVFDRKDIINTMCKFNFKDCARDFKIIENNTKSVYVLTDENEELISALRKGEYSKELFRKLQKYAVSLYEYELEKLDKDSAIEMNEDGLRILIKSNRYDSAGIIIPDSDLGNAIIF